MTARPVTADLFMPLAGIPADVLAGLVLLERGPPLWPIGADRWAAAVAAMRDFAERFDSEARACGWDSLSLYGLSQTAPYANLAAMGAAWLLARSGHRAVAVMAGDVLVVAPTGSMLRIYRGELDQGAVLAWAFPQASP